MKLINALPEAPLLTDAQNTFNNKAFAFVDALDGFVSDTNEVAVELNSLSQTVSNNANSAAEAKTQALNYSAAAKQSSDQAAAFAASLINTPNTQATSATGLLIGYGLKTFTILQTGKTFIAGQFVQIVYDANRWMLGVITSFNASTKVMVVDVTKYKGGGQTLYTWTITPSNPVSLEDCVVAMSTSFGSGVPTSYGSNNFKNVSGITSVSTGTYIVNLVAAVPLQTVFVANFTTQSSTPEASVRGGNVQIDFYGGQQAIRMRFYSGSGNFFTPENVSLLGFSF